MRHPFSIPVTALLALVGTMSTASAAPVTANPDPMGIFGGETTPTCGWPSVVALGGCTGTLIHPEIVAYAAHCGPDVSQVWFGETQFAGEGFAVATEFCQVNVNFALGAGNDYAFCKLAEPVTNVPFTPPLTGCETTLLTPGREVALVGFGFYDEDNSGVKHQITTTLNAITDGGEAQTGSSMGEGVCFGDSGGPAFVRLDESLGGDGSWRAFGIASYIQNGCGTVGYHTLIPNAIEFIETNSGVDVTPCHYRSGEWGPSPSCGAFETEPNIGEGKTWDEGCAGGPVTEFGGSCGEPFNDLLDSVGPEVEVVSPRYGTVFESDPDTGTALIDAVVAEATDDVSGVVSLSLRIQGVVPDNAVDTDPEWSWGPISLPPGVWELSVIATDYAGNESISEDVVIGVDMEPPPAPEPETSSSGGETGDSESTTSGDGTTTGSESTTGETPLPGTGSEGSTTGDAGGTSDRPEPLPPTSGTAIDIDDDGGCGCSSNGEREIAWSLFPLLGLLLHRRRQSSVSAR